MRRALTLLALCLPLATLPVIAQEEDEDDSGFIVRFLERQLSDGARDVQIEGFSGYLSTTAGIERLTIADAEGIWLTLENAELDWSRRALFDGRLQIRALTATRLDVSRRPNTDPQGLTLPEAEATPFSLPDLPLSIEIDQAGIDRVSLGPDILGLPADLTVSGRARLAEGEGEADLEIRRLDGPQGVFDLSGSYSNTTRILTTNLLLDEAPGGLAATLLNLPDRPAIRLAIDGTGPIDDFTADIALESDGELRLSGAATTALVRDLDMRNLALDLSGNISPLIQTEYREFFGDAVELHANARLFRSGAVEIDTLSVQSAALSLSGDLSLASDGRPQAFDLMGRVGDATSNASIRLPVPDTDIRVQDMALTIEYDAEAGNRYVARFDLQDLETDTLEMRRLSLDANGSIVETAEGDIAVGSPVQARVEGLTHSDPATANALGETASLRGQVSWVEGTPLIVTGLEVVADDLSLTGDATFQTDETRLIVNTTLEAEAGSLSRFADAAGQPLSGAVAAELSGQADLLSGAFDMVLDGQGRNLVLADGLPPGLLTGQTDLRVSALRDETGLTLREARVNGQQIRFGGSGRVSDAGSALEATARLNDIGLFVDSLSGPVDGDLVLSRSSEANAPWRVQADLTGQAGIVLDLRGTAQPEAGTVNMTASGRAPLALANRAISPRSLTGTLGFEAALNGRPSLAALSGRFSTSGARLSLPIVQTAVQDISLSGNISGGRLSFDASGALTTGGALGANGTVTLTNTNLPATIDLTGQNLRLIDPTLYEALIARAGLRVTGNLANSFQVSGSVDMGETEFRVPETGIGSVANIPPITHIGETAEERRTRIAAGLGPQRSGGGSGGGGGSSRIGLDITVNAPSRIFVRGRGLDAELGGSLRIGGTTANVLPSGRFDLIRGRLNLLGTRLDLTEGSAILQGSFDPFIRLVASTRSGGYLISINVVGEISAPDVSFTSEPSLPEDEVLAQLLFGRSVSSLSPVQLLQLADAAASLAGGSTSSGFLTGLRENLGLDDLDLQTDEEGNAAVRAGRYLSENVYADVTVGGGQTDLSLNIDLTPNVTARGSFSSDGSSSLGVFYERDY